MRDLAGGVAVVTGASAGIGAGTARALGRAGMRVALCARRRDRLERLRTEMLGTGSEAAAYPVDVTDAPAVRAMVDDVAARWGRIDVLVNNAGRGLAARFEDTTPEEFRELMELNVLAVVTATQAVLPVMRRQGRGHIINVSSVVGRRGIPGRSAYAATKFALRGLSEALRMELRGSGIAVSLVFPIYTRTEFHDVEPSRMVFPRMGAVQSVEQVARAILRCVQRPRPEVYPYWPARLLAVLNATSPGAVDRLIAALRR
ncbi:MAG: SDR family NAD(P)-dependent oxidoreductase [Candidatus Rokubacteria bacterium]|nr:SDR family NAD(P)-dependent oxidoreductase [Candidatus Rokubacteria bacterium]